MHLPRLNIRSRKAILLPLAMIPLFLISLHAESIRLVEYGKSEYQIVVPEESSPATRYAADELQRFFAQSTGATLPIVSDASPPSKHEIVLGNNRRLTDLKISPKFEELGSDGFVLKSAGPHFVIAGGSPRGTLYGVYQFLEDHLGCRWFTPTISRIPQHKSLQLAPLDQTIVPPVAYREVMLFDCWEADWMARNRLNSTQVPEEKHGGSIQFVPGYYVHTYEKLVPPDTFFDTHPEYFSEVDGKRIREKTQLCATNDDVARIAIERVKKLLREHPECQIISVSQNDSNDNYCRCTTCAALDEKENSHSGQVIYFVNRIAEGIASEFPDRLICTLAYEWSRPPPANLKPHDNVIVRLSTIRCSFSRPLEEQRRQSAFRNDLEGWGKISRQVWIWDYTTYFSYYPLPWPNYRVMDDNIRYFVKNNVRGIVEQNNWQSSGSELAGLKGYLLARFLWDPTTNETSATTEFLEGVYGPAAPAIQSALNLLADKVEEEDISLTIYGSRTPKYLTREILEEADRHWDQAVEAVADNPELLRRVEAARLSQDYAYIEHFRWKPQGMVTYDGPVKRGNIVAVDPAYRKRIERFIRVSKEMNITHIREGKPDYAEYLAWLENLIAPSP